jgi:hypothetical protein
MVESRWLRRAGPGVAAVGALVVIASTTFGAGSPEWDPPGCSGPVGPAGPAIGAWYQLDPLLHDGAWAGQRLTLGRAGGGRPWHLYLDAESFASGPQDGTVLVGTDDGTSSSLTLFDLAAGCRWDLATSPDVIRHATISPDRRSALEHHVDRRSRADLGVWRRPLGGGAPVRALAPIQADLRFGPTWRTQLSWSDDGRLLVESCGEVSCRFRFVTADGGAPQTVADPSLGSLVGLVGDRLVAHGACRGLPCPLLSIDVDTGRSSVLDATAGRAVIGRDGLGRPVVIHEVGADGHALRIVSADGRQRTLLDAEPGQGRLVANPAWSGGAAEHPADWIVFGPDGRLPIDGSASALLRHVGDGRTVSLQEIVR